MFCLLLRLCLLACSWLLLLRLLLLLLVLQGIQCSSSSWLQLQDQEALQSQQGLLRAMHIRLRIFWHGHHHHVLITSGHSSCHLHKQQQPR